MKRIIGFLIIMLMIVSMSPLINSKKIDNNQQDIQNELANITDNKENVNCENCININEYPKGILYHPLMTIDYESFITDEIPRKRLILETPDYFSWMDHEGYDWTTPAKNQGGCGSCWAFAAMSVLEGIIKIREGIPDLNPDLSEQYILSCLPSAGSCDGGSPLYALQYILDNGSDGNYCNGIIPEFCFPYQANDEIPCDNKSDNWENYLIPIIEVGSVEKDIDVIKSVIMDVGPVVAGIFASEEFITWGYNHHLPVEYYSYEKKLMVNHLVAIVGWNDDKSIEKGGYWICKNSWGTHWGYDGFFNIEYESLSIQRNQMIWVDYNPDDYSWQPVPNINGPYYGLVNNTIQFQGEAAGEYPPFTYKWDFGDGTYSEGQHPNHMYNLSGEYDVTFTVTDNMGTNISETTFSHIQETNQPPRTPKIDGPVEITKGKYCWYNITIDDPDLTPLYIYIEAFNMDFGDWMGPFDPGVIPIYHYWSETGDYQVRAKTKDPCGAESDWATLEVTVPRNKFSVTNQNILQNLIQRFPILENLL